MRFERYACVSALVAGLAAFSLQARTEAAQVVAPPDPPAADRVTAPMPSTATQGLRAAAPDETEPAEAATSQERTRGAVGRPTSNQRDLRRRGRSWYEEPLPSPSDWEPPEGPVRIALQAGHWRADEAPPELSGLRDNGTKGGGKVEWETNLEIAQRAAAMLEELGYQVDILPAVVPPRYRAHVFISIHADGSNDPAASGYRVAGPRRDATGRAQQLVALLEQSYGEATGLRRLPTVTRRMRNYYAFNYRRYQHALHPMTIGVIIETGFLTSPRDRRVIVNDPDRAARGIVEAVLAFPETPPPGLGASIAGGEGD